MELTEKWKLTIQKTMQTLLWKETKFHNRIDTSAWRRPIDSEWIITLVTIPLTPFSISHTPTQEKIALLELELCYLQVRSCLSQVRIIRISQQTSSWANPTFKVPFRFLVVWLEFISFEWLLKCWWTENWWFVWNLTVSVFVLVNEITFLMSFLFKLLLCLQLVHN